MRANRGTSGRAWAAPWTDPTKFRRFGGGRANAARATARSILGQSARSRAKMAGRSPRDPAEKLKNKIRGAQPGRFDILNFDNRITTLPASNQYLQLIRHLSVCSTLHIWPVTGSKSPREPSAPMRGPGQIFKSFWATHLSLIIIISESHTYISNWLWEIINHF